MSGRVGDTARFQLRRKAGVKRRERSRAARAAMQAAVGKAPETGDEQPGTPAQAESIQVTKAKPGPK